MAIKLGKHINLSLALLASMAIAGSCTAAPSPTVTTNYQVSWENFPNPERGFYYNVLPVGDNPITPLQLSELQKFRSDNLSLIGRYYLLADFRDKPISQSYLEMISNDLRIARQAGVKVSVSFAYNWLGGGSDAPASIVLSHLDQLKPILQANYDVIAYMNAGFIGNWGEWHSSTNKLVDSWSLDPTEGAKNIFFKILSVLPKERMVALRYPKHKKQLFNNYKSLIPTEAFNGSDRARTGHVNNGFRASIDDGGTYPSTDPNVVNQEKAWLNLDTRYVVQSGEPAWASEPPEYDDCPGALADFAQMHWSAMAVNQTDASEVFRGWKAQGCMAEIQRRLGYRFRLLNSTISTQVKPSGSFSTSFQIINDGWASPYNPRNIELILRNRKTNQEYYTPIAEAVRMWMPGETKTVKVVAGIPSSMPPGEYQVFLNFPDPTSKLRKRPEYSIRLANQNVWEASTGYNYLLSNVIIDTNATGNAYSGSKFFQSR